MAVVYVVVVVDVVVVVVVFALCDQCFGCFARLSVRLNAFPHWSHVVGATSCDDSNFSCVNRADHIQCN